ncbi:hypothetical protein ACPZ19_07085 [Amycolatopsis lurida]
MAASGVAAAVVACCVVWWLGSGWLAWQTTDAALRCRLDQLTAFSGFGLVLWGLGSAMLFLLAGAGLAGLLARYWHPRSRRGPLVIAGCVLLVALGTWAHVSITHTLMRSADEHGTHNAVPVDGALTDSCFP